MVCVGLQQFAELAAFFSVPASSRKFRPLATNQKVGSSNLSGRATCPWSGPETWVTQCTGYMGNTLLSSLRSTTLKN